MLSTLTGGGAGQALWWNYMIDEYYVVFIGKMKFYT